MIVYFFLPLIYPLSENWKDFVKFQSTPLPVQGLLRENSFILSFLNKYTNDSEAAWHVYEEFASFYGYKPNIKTAPGNNITHSRQYVGRQKERKRGNTDIIIGAEKILILPNKSLPIVQKQIIL